MNYKFRVYDHVTDSIIYFDLRYPMGHLLNYIPNNQIDVYTGFKDKNGINIYTNDYLVKESDFIAGFSGQLMNFNNRVFSIPGCFWTENLEYLHEHTDILSAAPDVLPGLVVIGNSHTGPLK